MMIDCASHDFSMKSCRKIFFILNHAKIWQFLISNFNEKFIIGKNRRKQGGCRFQPCYHNKPLTFWTFEIWFNKIRERIPSFFSPYSKILVNLVLLLNILTNSVEISYILWGDDDDERDFLCFKLTNLVWFRFIFFCPAKIEKIFEVGEKEGEHNEVRWSQVSRERVSLIFSMNSLKF